MNKEKYDGHSLAWYHRRQNKLRAARERAERLIAPREAGNLLRKLEGFGCWI